MYRLILSVYFLLFLSMANAQEKPDFITVDQKTYRYYLETNWDSLIFAGTRAIRENIDYYYLRMRLGIAWFEKKNYRRSIIHFENALDFSPGDLNAGKYLYYAYLFSGRNADAFIVYGSLPGNVKKQINRSGSFILSVGFTYDHSFTSDPIGMGSYPADNLPVADGSQPATKSYRTTSITLKHMLGRRVSVVHTPGYLHKTNFRYLQYQGNTLMNEEEKISQVNYYLSLDILAAKGFHIIPSFHYLAVRIPSYYFSGTGRYGQQQSYYDYTIRQMNDYVLSLSLLKDLGAFTFQTGSSWAGLNNRNQLQYNIQTTWYPPGNLDLYINLSVSRLTEYAGSEKIRSEWIYNPLIGLKITDFLWAEIEGNAGKMHNFSDKNGSIVYNNADITKMLAGGSLIVPFGKKGSTFFLRYFYSENESRFIPLENTNQYYNIIEYQSNIIKGGIQWKF